VDLAVEPPTSKEGGQTQRFSTGNMVSIELNEQWIVHSVSTNSFGWKTLAEAHDFGHFGTRWTCRRSSRFDVVT
jgi:hypothetical protein